MLRGAADPQLRRSLDAAPPPLDGSGSDAVLLVAVQPDDATLRQGLREVGDRAVIYIECSTRRQRLLAVRRLRTEGFHVLSRHALWPGIIRPTAFVPLDDGILQQAAARTRHGIEAPVLAALARRGAIGLASRAACIIAVGPAWHGGRRAQVLPQPADDDPRGRPPVPLLFTPRHAASQHVVALTRNHASKVARGEDRELCNERAALAALARCGSPAARPQLLEPVDDDRLVTTRLAGRPITPRAARRQPDRVLALALSWLQQLPVGPAPGHDTRVARLVEDPLQRLVVAGAPIEPVVVEATRAAAAQLRSAELPVVFEHGDLRPPNLFVHRGQLAVLDWELAQAEGLPLHDLLYLVDFLQTRAGAIGDAAIRAELDRLAVPTELLAPLELVSWARRAVGLAERSSGFADDRWSASAPSRRWRELALRPATSTKGGGR
ncbi:MAG: phosphotransferase family protein [Acidimicrobiia bacterium]